MFNKRAVLYSFKNYNKFNGTLFYCFEYFCKAKDLDSSVEFIISNITDQELNEVIYVFEDKYDFNREYLSSIKKVNGARELYLLNYRSYLILDIHTFNQVYYFLKGNIHCFSNVGHSMKRSEFKNIIYYGSYSYQNYDVKTYLKLNFSIFKKISNSDKNGLFVSSRKDNYSDFELPKEIAHLKPINKNKNGHYKNLYELFDTVYYYHSDLDTNNRLIPEAFYYNKKVIIEFNGNYNDSIYFRYKDITENGLGNYTLRDDDLMLKAFLGDN